MTTTTSGRYLFSWLHLSDIHFGHGDEPQQWSQKRITEDLLGDVLYLLDNSAARLDPTARIPRPQGIFITGDIAFKGSATEYDQAREWLQKLVKSVGLTRRNVFVIPGNHDVQRTDKKERQAFRLLSALREQRESLDDALADVTDRMALTQRLVNYLAFASEFAPACRLPLSRPEQWLFWSHRLQPHSGINFRLHILGLNSALLCNDDHDEGHLLLGAQQMAPLAEPKQSGELLIVLTHHPLTWLADTSNEHVQRIFTGGNVHLSGHIHQPKTEHTKVGSGEEFIRIVAGAVHGDGGEPRKESYNFGAIFEKEDKTLELRIWPRRWQPDPGRFDWDQTLLPRDGPKFAAHPLQCKVSGKMPDRPAPSPSLLEPFSQPIALRPERGDAIIDPESARDWLSSLNLYRPEDLIAGNVLLEDGTALPQEPPRADDPFKAAVIEQLRQRAIASLTGPVAQMLLHGIRGVGKTMLLLRYIASGRGEDVRVFVDCGSKAEQFLRMHEQLETHLRNIQSDDDTRNVFVAIDGLDIACREQVVHDGQLKADDLLFGQIEEFKRTVTKSLVNLDSRSVYLLFTADDPPEWRWEVVSREDWATSCFKQFMQQEPGNWLSFRLEPPASGPDLSILRRILPRTRDGYLWHKYPFLVLPVFFDAVREGTTDGLRGLHTKRQFLDRGAGRMKFLRERQHSYYKTLAELNQFMEVLNVPPNRLNKDDCVRLIEKELTGDWMYLFDTGEEANWITDPLERLHRWFIGDGWRYSNSYALSNTVSMLSLLSRFAAHNATYSHCNLRNVQIFNNARIFDSEFYGVDFSGAIIHSATIMDAKFYGVDFTETSLTGSRIEGNTRFVGC